jgi:hypothetical protein
MQRLLFECISLVMAILFVIPFGVCFEQWFGFPLWRTAFLPCFAVIGHIAGRATLRSQEGVAMGACGISAVVATVLTGIFLPGWGLGGIICLLLTLAGSVFLFLCARKAGYSLYTPMAVVGILADLGLILICAIQSIPEASQRVVSLSACAYFLLSLYAFNSSSLRSSLHKGTTARNIRYPRGIKMNNFGMLTAFIVLAILISNIYPLFQGFSTVFMKVLSFLVKCFSFLSLLFDRRGVLIDAEEESSSTTVDDEDNIYAYEPKGESAIITTIVEIFAMIVVAILLCYLAYRAVKYLKAHLKGAGGMIGRLRGMFAVPVDDDYVDEEESLTLKEILAQAGKSLSENAKKIAQRPQRIDDFPDDRLKIRFVYQHLLKSLRDRDPGCLYQTPNEFQAKELDSDEDVTSFIAAYNTVKYADGAPGPDDIQAARRLLKRKF